MRHLILIFMTAIAICTATAQTIEIKHHDAAESYKVSEIDRISHEYNDGDIVRTVWNGNEMVSESIVSVGDIICYVKPEPTIVGIWDVVESYLYRPYPNAEWQTRTRTYVLEFNEDGSFTKSDTSYESSTWSYSANDGGFSARGFVIATATQVSWDRFTGIADDKDNPTKITGKRYEGNTNTTTNVEELEGEFEMTRRE